MCIPGMSASHSSSQGSEDKNTYGSHTAILSDQWKDAFGQLSGSVNADGANANQQTAIDWYKNNMTNNPVWNATNSANNFYNNINAGLQSVADNQQALSNQNAPQAMAYQGAAYNAATAAADGAPDVSAQSGADFIDRYMNPYDTAVIRSSVDDYNANADRALNQMRVGRDSAGAFGDRAAIADAVYQADATRGLGSLVSGLRQQGFNNAANFGQQDAARSLQAAQANQATAQQRNIFNAGQQQQNNQYNAGQQQQNSQFNAGQQQQNSQFNAGAEAQNRTQQLAALRDIQGTAAQMANVSQSVVNNIVTANGIDAANAKALLDSGVITSGQLAAIVSAAQAANGYDYSENSSSRSRNSNTSVTASL